MGKASRLRDLIQTSNKAQEAGEQHRARTDRLWDRQEATS